MYLLDARVVLQKYFGLLNSCLVSSIVEKNSSCITSPANIIMIDKFCDICENLVISRYLDYIAL